MFNVFEGIFFIKIILCEMVVVVENNLSKKIQVGRLHKILILWFSKMRRGRN